MVIQVDGWDGVAWSDLWPHHIASGDSEAWVGGSLMVAVTRAFTYDEDTVFRWLVQHDDAVLYAVHHLTDGRDLMVFDRLFTRQDKEQALAEHRQHLRALMNLRGFYPPVLTLTNAT